MRFHRALTLQIDFQFRWLQHSIIEIENAASNPLMSNHPKWNSPWGLLRDTNFEYGKALYGQRSFISNGFKETRKNHLNKTNMDKYNNILNKSYLYNKYHL